MLCMLDDSRLRNKCLRRVGVMFFTFAAATTRTLASQSVRALSTSLPRAGNGKSNGVVILFNAHLTPGFLFDVQTHPNLRFQQGLD